MKQYYTCDGCDFIYVVDEMNSLDADYIYCVDCLIEEMEEKFEDADEEEPETETE